MKMGIKEFREQLGKVARGDRIVEITDRGRIVGMYRPKRAFDRPAARRAAQGIVDWQSEMRTRGVDLDKILADLGLDSNGDPLSVSE